MFAFYYHYSPLCTIVVMLLSCQNAQIVTATVHRSGSGRISRITRKSSILPRRMTSFQHLNDISNRNALSIETRRRMAYVSPLHAQCSITKRSQRIAFTKNSQDAHNYYSTTSKSSISKGELHQTNH